MLKVAEALKIKKPKNQEIKNNESPLLDQRIIDLEKKENIELMNNNSPQNKNNVIDMSQILNDTIKEKKENDKIERERKKANKIRQMKMSIKNRKNMSDYINQKMKKMK